MIELFLAVKHLGFKVGWRYWKLNRLFRKSPTALLDLIDNMRAAAKVEPEFPWNDLADDLQKYHEKHKDKN